ncbi:ING4-like protein [Mya arenaria]|uniref:ING4-like protein n=1 Tax=Mya arenaria TaxID=6604 RepID=A0ABY7GB38_MYAAR|nr:uncharacterized protein LOC128223893 [Mya arenaria]WAR31610.1 ING4-like protein [Mya arenaria]
MSKKLSFATEYKDSLDSVAKKRYEQKITIVGGVDPYATDLVWSKDVACLPSVTHIDIVHYLLFTPSPYTKEDLKAWKSLDAVNQLCSGWVQERSSYKTNNHVIVTAKVLHSQRLREKPLRPWVIVKPDGVVEGAHCNCMAGLGEACTHIAALLFSISAAVQIRDSQTCTQSAAYWKIIPASVKTIRYKTVSNINFTSAKTAKKHFDDNLQCMNNGEIPVTNTPSVRKVKTPRASEADFMSFCQKLSVLKSKPAVLSVIEPYAADYVPTCEKRDFPLILSELKDPDMIGEPLCTVQSKCKNIRVSCSKEQSENVEVETRLQSKSKLWNQFRAGRITASNMRSVVFTDPDKPSKSLVKKICYPETQCFQTEAMKWGTVNERVALKQFVEYTSPKHENLLVRESGFIISEDLPCIGASPDGITACDCCGNACIEIKCPFNARNDKIDENTCDFLVLKNDQLHLSENHKYYYQIQTQLGVCKQEMCFFVVWTLCDLFIKEVKFNPIVWEDICSKSKGFFECAVLPELVGKVFTSLPVPAKQPVLNTIDNVKQPVLKAIENVQCSDTQMKPVLLSDSEERYCYCDQVESGKMIACDNNDCSIVWFHFTCLKLENSPRGKWYCPDCRKLPAFKRLRKK